MKDSITQNTPDTPAVEVRDLSVEYHSGGNIVKAVNHVSFTLPRGRSLGLVGETGAGKTSTALALMRLLPDRVGHVPNGEIYLKGDNIMNVPESHMKLMRGEIISMIFQDPMTALNPIMTVGNQIREALKIHDTKNHSKAEIETAFYEWLLSELPEAERDAFCRTLDALYRRAKRESRAGFPEMTRRVAQTEENEHE